MSAHEHARNRLVRSPRPWTLGSELDREFDDALREHNHARLTDPQLERRFGRRYPLRHHADYDEMVRALGYVWDCRYDGTATVTGYCCAVCGRGRAQAGG